MPVQSDAERALTLIAQSGFEMNDACEKAHEIAQAHEGEPLFDAIHALIHRIEGDTANAAYWDRRAGTNFGTLGYEKELAAIRNSMSS
jgi:hypothetical protein